MKNNPLGHLSSQLCTNRSPNEFRKGSSHLVGPPFLAVNFEGFFSVCIGSYS